MNTKQIFAMFSMALMLFLPITTVHALAITDVNIEQVSDRYARINWQTDENSDSLLRYDITNTTLALDESDSTLVTNHTIMLTNLLNGTRYFFEVESTNENGTVGDNNSDVYHQFVTDASDTTPPFIIADLPAYNPGTSIDIQVETEPNALIRIFVNDFNNLTRFKATDISGSFTFPSITLVSGNNNIKIQAEDPSGLINEEIFIVFADTSPPDVTFDTPVKSAYTTTTVTLSGQVTDNSAQPVSMFFYIDNVLKQTLANLSSPWSVTLDFETNGFHDLRIVAQDVAGIEFSRTFEDILIDTTPLRITDSNLDEISPAYTIHQTITGHVNKPHARITVLVNNRTSSEGVLTTSVRDLITSLIKGDVDYESEADENGNFSIEIQLSQDPLFRLQQRDVPTAASQVRHRIEF